MERLSKAEKKIEALEKINEADLITIDDLGWGTLTSLSKASSTKLLKVVRISCSAIIVSQRPGAHWYGGRVENTSLMCYATA